MNHVIIASPGGLAGVCTHFQPFDSYLHRSDIGSCCLHTGSSPSRQCRPFLYIKKTCGRGSNKNSVRAMSSHMVDRVYNRVCSQGGV